MSVSGTGGFRVIGRRPLLGAAAGLTVPYAAPAVVGKGVASAAPSRLRESDPRDLPALTWTDAEGRETGPAAFAGRGVVLNLWATWCAPCVAEMPALDRAAAALAGEGITVVALSSDRGGKAQVDPFYARVGLKTLGIWLDPRAAVTRALGVHGLPTTVLIGRDGRERARLEGAAEWDSPEMLAAVRRLCGAGADPSLATGRT